MLLLLALILVEQPQKETYKPGYCFSPISAEDTNKYMELLCEMRRSAFFAQTAGIAKLGRGLTGQVKLIDDLIKSMREEHICWDVKVNTVGGGRIQVQEFKHIRLVNITCDEPWVKKLRRGNMITVKGIVTKIEPASVFNDHKFILVVEELVAEQYKPQPGTNSKKK